MTWTRCECCGWEGEDEVTQFLIEEAAFTALDVFQSQERAKAAEESTRGANLEAMAQRAIGR